MAIDKSSLQSVSKSLVLPNTKLARRVTDMVKSESSEYLYNHCVRTYLFAVEIARLQKMEYDPEIVYIACLMHDLGLLKKHYGKARFEVDGADAAVKFLSEHDADDKLTEVVWDAIALHSTMHIPLRKRAEVALVHIGAGADVMGIGVRDINPLIIKQILEEYPRQNFKANIIDDLVSYLKGNPSGGSLRRTLRAFRILIFRSL